MIRDVIQPKHIVMDVMRDHAIEPSTRARAGEANHCEAQRYTFVTSLLVMQLLGSTEWQERTAHFSCINSQSEPLCTTKETQVTKQRDHLQDPSCADMPRHVALPLDSETQCMND